MRALIIFPDEAFCDEEGSAVVGDAGEDAGGDDGEVDGRCNGFLTVHLAHPPESAPSAKTASLRTPSTSRPNTSKNLRLLSPGKWHKRLL